VSSGRAYAGLCACAALWGLVFIAVHDLLPQLDAVQLMTVRFALVSLLFAALMAARAGWRPRLARREWAIVVLSGLLAVPGSQLAIVEGQRYLSPPLASLIVTFSPAVAAILAAPLLRERLSTRQAAGFAIALGGVALIVVLGAGSGASLEASDPLGAAIAAITPLSWALYTIVSKPLAARHTAVGTVGLGMIVGTLALAPAYPHAVDGAAQLSLGGWLWILYLAAGGTVATYILWFAALRALPVGRTTAFMYLIPVFATCWTATILGELPTAVTLAGGALVVAGVALTQDAPVRISAAARGGRAWGARS
jgi:drug/metabolite transporter (DMT)-like permease